MEIINREFIELNIRRSIQVFNKFPSLITSGYFLIGSAEELGEICKAHKKIERGCNQRDILKLRQRKQYKNLSDIEIIQKWQAEKEDNRKEEIADLLISTLLYAASAGVDVNEAIQSKFNLVSKEMQAPEEFIIPE